MADEVRRVVTGVNENGKAVFLSDEPVEIIGFSNSPPGTGIAKVWGSNESPTVPVTDASFDYDTVYPPPTGFRYQYWRVMPDSARDGLVPLDPDVMGEEMDTKYPGLREHLEPGGSGMHTTPTIDIGIVIEGEIWLELDDGAERLLRTGDTYVQNGTRHACAQPLRQSVHHCHRNSRRRNQPVTEQRPGQRRAGTQLQSLLNSESCVGPAM